MEMRGLPLLQLYPPLMKHTYPFNSIFTAETTPLFSAIFVIASSVLPTIGRPWICIPKLQESKAMQWGGALGSHGLRTSRWPEKDQGPEFMTENSKENNPGSKCMQTPKLSSWLIDRPRSSPSGCDAIGQTRCVRIPLVSPQSKPHLT